MALFIKRVITVRAAERLNPFATTSDKPGYLYNDE